jgi:hypothetical protein
MRPIGWILVCILFLSATEVRSQGFDLRDHERFFPRRWSHMTIVDISDEFRIMDSLTGPGVYNWQGQLIKPLSRGEEKKWFALFQTPIGDKAMIYVARWDDGTWIRGVWAQVWSLADGRLLWEGNLSDVDGGDGGTVDHFACIHDLDGDGYSDITFHEYSWYYTYDTLDETGMRESERYWTLHWNGNGFDSLELKVTDVVRHQFYEGFKTAENNERWVIHASAFDSLTSGKLQRLYGQTRTYLLLPKGQGGSSLGKNIWEGSGVTEYDLPKVNPVIKYKNRIDDAYFSLRQGHAETLYMILPHKYRSRSKLFLEKDDCKPGGPFSPETKWRDLYQYECDCKDKE